MADHVVCVSVRIKNHNNNLENLISKRIGRFNHKLTLEDICNEVLGDSELDPSVNKALDLQQVKVELSSTDSSSDKFEIDFTEELKTAVEFQTNLKFIVFTIFARGATIRQQRIAIYCDMENPHCDTYTWYLYFCLLLPLVQYYNTIQGSWNCHLLHTVIFSATPFVPQGEMIEFVPSLLDISLQQFVIVCLPSFLKPKVAVSCWSNLIHEPIFTSFNNKASVFEMRK